MRVLPIPLLELKILQVGEFAPRKRGNAAQKLNNLHFYAHAEKFGGEMNSQGDHKCAFYDEKRNVARIQAYNFKFETEKTLEINLQPSLFGTK